MKDTICDKQPSWLWRIVRLDRLIAFWPYAFLIFMFFAVIGKQGKYGIALGVVPIWMWLRERDKRIIELERQTESLREALGSVLDWAPTPPDYWDSGEQDAFMSDMIKAHEVLNSVLPNDEDHSADQ